MATDHAKAGCSKHTDSSEVKEYICSECFKSGIRTDATHYCPSCDTFYCKPCLCDHNVLGRSDIHQWGSSKRRKTEDVCVRHSQEAVLLFCKTHDELCCRMCLISTRHRFCTDTAELKSLKDDISTQEDTRNILDMLSRLTIKAETLKRDRNLRCETVDSTYNVCLMRIGEFRKRVNSAFDEIEVELSKYRHSYIDRFRLDQKVCENALASIGLFQQSLGDEHLNTSYVLKKYKKWAEYTNENFVEMNKIAIKDSFVPIALSDIDSTVQTINKLGEIKFAFLSFSVKLDGDANKCKVAGMCQTPDGSLIVADTLNKKLKRFDTEYKATGHCEFKSCPSDVCCVSDTEVAVVKDDGTIQFVTVGTTLEAIRSISVQYGASNIASFKDMLVCTSYIRNSIVRVSIYDMNGLSIISKAAGHPCDQGSTPTAISKDSSRIYIAPKAKELFVYAYEDSLLKKKETIEVFDKILGVCVDDGGFVYVSDGGKNEVKKLDSQSLDGVVASLAVPETPGPLCYDRLHDRVFVSCENSDTVLVV